MRVRPKMLVSMLSVIALFISVLAIRNMSGILGNVTRYQLNTSQSRSECATTATSPAAIATRLHRALAAQKFPSESEWRRASPIVFCRNWKGAEADRSRETEFRFLWSRDVLYIRIRAHYQDLFVYPEMNVRRENLWQRDVAEIFLQTDAMTVKQYNEFEISPNGNWLDLGITPGAAFNLLCPIKTNAGIDDKKHIWMAKIAVPMQCLTQNFTPTATWRLNLFRIEGQAPARFYSAWRPTNTSKPNFHVPEVFGTLTFALD